MSSNSNQQFWDHPLRPLWTCRTPSWRFKFIGKQNVCPMSKCLWFGDTLDKAQKQINLLILLEKIFLAIIHLNPCSKFEKKWTLHQLDLCQQLICIKHQSEMEFVRFIRQLQNRNFNLSNWSRSIERYFVYSSSPYFFSIAEAPHSKHVNTHVFCVLR